MKITPVRYGETVLPESWIFRDGDPAQSEKFIQYYRDGWKILTCHDL